MINITSLDLDNLEKGKSGYYGVIYRNKDKAYKIYKKEIKVGFSEEKKNPMRRYRKCIYRRMIDLNDKLQYTDLCSDVVFADGEFAGICFPFYEGELLLDLRDSPFDLKMDISRQLVRNSKELTDNYVYPYDYKLKNLMLVDGEVKILDLDDIVTKYSLLPNLYRKRKTIKGLDETIKTFFGEYDRCHFHDFNDGEELSRPRYRLSSNYEGINEYLKEKDKKINFLIVDYKLLDDDTIPLLLNLEGYKIIVTYSSQNYFNVKAKDILSNIIVHNGSIFDFVQYDKLDSYFTNYNVEGLVEYNGQLVKVR